MDSTVLQQIELAKAAIEKCRSLGLPKSEPIGRFVARLAEEANVYPVPNLAVDICLQSYTSTMLEQLGKDDIEGADIEQAARIAYAATLPKLSNADCIRDFIACVVHGMAIGAIPSSEGTRLLYGAQVAHSALPGGKKRRTKRTKSVPNMPSSATLTKPASTT
jgi:hypothetical protein